MLFALESNLAANLLYRNLDEDGVASVVAQGEQQLHPGGRHLAPLLFSLFQLARVLHQLFTPEARQLLSPAFAGAHELLPCDITTILSQAGLTQTIGLEQRSLATGGGGGGSAAQSLERIQSYLIQLHSNLFSIISLFSFYLFANLISLYFID